MRRTSRLEPGQPPSTLHLIRKEWTIVKSSQHLSSVVSSSRQVQLAYLSSSSLLSGGGALTTAKFGSVAVWQCVGSVEHFSRNLKEGGAAASSLAAPAAAAAAGAVGLAKYALMWRWGPALGRLLPMLLYCTATPAWSCFTVERYSGV